MTNKLNIEFAELLYVTQKAIILEDKITSNEYDMSIHTNPDARAWAKFFAEKYKVWSEAGVEADTEELMTAWFANAMMAMHDHLVLKGSPINGDHAEFLLSHKVEGK